jgi:hypothetical protein
VVKPPWTLLQAITVQAPLQSKIDQLTGTLNLVQAQVATQSAVLNVIKAPLTTVSGTTVGPRPTVGDPGLDQHLAALGASQQLVDQLRTRLLDPALDPASAGAVKAQIDAAETDLAQAAVATSAYVASTGIPISQGTDGYTALAVVSQTVGNLKSPTAIDAAKTGLTGAAGAAKNADARIVLGNLARFGGG